MDRRTEVSLHEAGHAVCALLLGKAYGCAIHGDGIAAGGLAGPGDLSHPAVATDYTPGDLMPCYRTDTMPDLMDDAVITAAGAVAVSLAGPAWALRDSDIAVRSCDRALITAAAWSAFPDCDVRIENAFCALAVARARRLLSPAFHRVRTVAAALAERGALSANDVARLAFPESAL